MELPHLYNLLHSGRFYKRAKGQVVVSFEDSNAFYLIRSGFVKRYLISKQGTLGVQSIYGPGYYFPLTAAFAALLDQKIYQGEEQYYYEAMTKVEIYAISEEDFISGAANDPLIYKELLYETGRRLQSNIQHLENMALKDPASRVAHLLVFYASRFGEKQGSGTVLKVPLKHKDLGDILSLSRETVSRGMAKLRAKELVIADKDTFIPDIDALKAFYS